MISSTYIRDSSCDDVVGLRENCVRKEVWFDEVQLQTYRSVPVSVYYLERNWDESTSIIGFSFKVSILEMLIPFQKPEP